MLTRVKMGFAKLAKDSREDGEESHTLRNLAMAGGMAAPWAGLIGQKPVLHEGKGPLMEWEEFQKNMRPGDIVIQGKPDPSAIKNFVGAVTGKPTAYHVEVVGPRGTKIDSGPRSGMASEPGQITLDAALREMGYSKEDIPHLPPDVIDAAKANLVPRGERLQLLRLKMTPAQRKEFMKNLNQGVSTSDAYNKALERTLAKSQPSAQQAAALAEIGSGGTYNMRSSLLGGIKELFAPKLKSESAVEAEKEKIIAARKAFIENQGGQLDAAAQAGADRLKTMAPFKKVRGSRLLLQTHVAPTCVGSVCSSFPAQALPKGINVVPGKGPHDILGPDWLRSEAVEPVARFDPHPTLQRHERLLRYGPTAARLGAGALLAGGIYGASKLLGGKKKAPSEPVPEERPYDEGAKAASALFL